jgi:hypothetical protein
MIRRMLVIVPTRGRPANVERLERTRAVLDPTAAWESLTEFLYVVDDDDPELSAYKALSMTRNPSRLIVAPRLRLAGTLNEQVRRHQEYYDAVGFMGDDHCPRTQGWDIEILSALNANRPGVVYGNDLLQGAALPTAVFMDCTIPRALGYFCPPGMTHLYLDNFWKATGEALGTLTYLPDVIIEHLHPGAGKAPMDHRYEEVNSQATWDADKTAWERYQTAGGGFHQDMARLKWAAGRGPMPA